MANVSNLLKQQRELKQKLLRHPNRHSVEYEVMLTRYHMLTGLMDDLEIDYEY